MRCLTCRRLLPLLVAVVAVVALARLPGVWAQQQAPEPDSPAPAEAAAPADQQQPVETEPPTFRAGINFIRVDVIATDDDGNFVRDLDASDFQVFEDGEPQEVESFQLVELGPVPEPDAEPPRPIINSYDEEREAARADTRIFVVFFDDYHVRWENGVRAGRTLARFIRENLRPTDMIGVMYPLTPVADVRLTRNHEAIAEAAENFYGVKYDYKPRNMFEQRYAQYPTEIVERLRNDVSLSALEGLMIRLGGVRDGRKNVLLISEGFTNYVPVELRSMNAEMLDGPDMPTVGNQQYEETAQFFSDSGMMFDLRDVFSTANRFNTTIYALDPRGLAISEFDVSQRSVNRRTDDRVMRATRDTLYVLARETDGRTIVNMNDLRPGLDQMLRDSSAYYLLGYNSSRAPTDGKYHEIEVRVQRDDVDVRHRQGYWALTERDVERAMTPTVRESPKAVDTALSTLAAPRRGRRLVRTWVGASRGESGRTRVTFLWEPEPAAGGRGEEPARVLLTAMSDNGGPGYRGRVPESEDSAGRGTGRRDAAPPGDASVQFEAAPGPLQLSLAIEDAAGDVIERDRRTVEIPDFTGTDLVLSTPSFVRVRNEMEWKAAVDNLEVLPTASREFRRTERVLIRFEAYSPGDVQPEVKARLLNRGGELMHPLDVRAAEPGRPYQVHLRPAHLPPGDYVIELSASSPTDEVMQMVAFRLRS